MTHGELRRVGHALDAGAGESSAHALGLGVAMLLNRGLPVCAADARVAMKESARDAGIQRSVVRARVRVTRWSPVC